MSDPYETQYLSKVRWVLYGFLTVAGFFLFTEHRAHLLGIMAPGYIARVWNLPVLSGVMVGAFPIEELLFGFGIGAYWTGVYEHLTWHRSFRLAE